MGGALATLMALAACAGALSPVQGGDAPAFRIFQFPANAIPRVDGDAADWEMVGPSYVIDTSAIAADDGSGRRPDPESLKVSIRVGWVKGLNRLYFLYEAKDNYWSFAQPGLTNDIFELVVDGDRSGGPLIGRFHPSLSSKSGAASQRGGPFLSHEQAWFSFQNVHAQNYHIFTPPGVKDWAMAWGPQAQWIKRLPWSNIAYHYDFKHGQPGKLRMEFWITPFDHADATGSAKSIETKLTENGVVAMAWAVIDDDGPAARRGFWNLSPHHTMYGQASQLCPFRLMPLELAQTRAMIADWSFEIMDRERRLVAFSDNSTGAVTNWRWDFGDGSSSSAKNPVHTYGVPGKFVVTLDVQGPAGKARHSKVWDVSFTADPPK